MSEDSNWRDLLILLQGNNKAGVIAVDVIVENIEKCINNANDIIDNNNNECYEHIQYDQDLADIFHELCTNVLQSSNWSTRVNAGYAICKLTEKYSNYLTPLLSLSSNDGQLLLLNELDIHSIIKYSDKSTLLSSSSSFLQQDTLNELYNKNWLTKQRKLLQKKLGIESLSKNTDFAMKYIDENVLIDEDDIIVNKNIKKRKRKNEVIDIINDTITATDNINDTITATDKNDENNNITNTTNETWIARLIRFLVVGLLDNRWETRHGCSIGLTSFINGLYPIMKVDDTNNENNNLNTKYTLPWFIVEDIICSGIGVLIYDQFLDFGLGISAVSPVKEACGQLITSAARSCDIIVINSVYNKLYDICNSLSNFNVRCGGLIALKYFIAVHGSLLFTDISSSNDKSLTQFVTLVKNFLTEQHDDLNNVACSLVKSIYYAISSIKRFNHQFYIKLDHFSFLYALIEGLLSSAIRLGPLSGSLLNLVDSTHICGKVYSQMNMNITTNREKDIHKCYLLLLQVISMIFSKLYQYSEDLRLKTITILVDSLETISIPICSTTVTLTEYSNVTALLFSSILISFSCRSGGSLGDLFLVNKVDQDRKDYDSPHSTNSTNIDTNDYIDDNTKVLVITESTAKVLTKTILQLLRHLIVSHRTESLEEFQIIVKSYDILMLLTDTMVLGTSNRSNLTTKKTPKKRKSTSLSLEEIKDDLVSQLIDSIKKFQIEFSLTSTSNSRFELISFSDTNSRVAFAHLVGSLLSHAHSLSSSSDTNNFFIQLFFNLTEHLILINNEVSSRNDNNNEKLKKKKFQFIVVADDGDTSKPSSSNIVLSNQDSNVSDVSNMVEVLLMIMINIFASSTRYSNDNDSTITALMNNINTLSNANTNIRSNSSVQMLTEALEYFHHHDVSKVLNLISNDDGNMMLSFTTMMASSLYISHYHDENTQRNDTFTNTNTNTNTNTKPLIDTVVTHLNSSQQSTMNTFIYFLARSLNSNIYSTIISPENIVTLSSSLSLSSTSSWNISATLSFLLASLKGVDSATKKSLIASEEFCANLISATVSSASNHYLDNPYISNKINSNNNDDNIDDDGDDGDDDNDNENNNNDNSSTDNEESKIITILISIVKTLSSRIDSSSLHQFLKSIMTALKSCMHSDDEGFRIASSQVFLELLLIIQEKVLPSYDMGFSIALRGLGDYSDKVRRFSAKSLRILVALAPLVRNSNHDSSDLGEASSIFKTKLLVNSPSDAPIIDFLQNVSNLLNNSTAQRPPIPGLCPDGLRDYQWEGVSWLTQLRRVGLGGILADDMGIGKTVQALTALAILRLENMINSNTNPNFNAHPFLIICPSMLILHWEQEIKKFFLPAIFTPKRYVFGETYDNSTIIIMSYDNIKIDYEHFLKNQMIFDAIVLDEAHVIRNPKTSVSRAVFSLKAKFRVALSGTPIQNKIEEIWSLFNFLIPDFLGNFKDFNKNYILPIKKSIKERNALNVDGVKVDDAGFQYSINISTEGMAVLRKLHKIILPFILRRTKNMVARELPSKTIIDVYCPLSITQKKLYVDFQKKLRICDTKLEEELLTIRNQELISVSKKSKTINDDDNNTETLNPLKAFFYLRYLCVHPSLVIAKLHNDYRNRLITERGVSGKMDRLARLLVDSQIILEDECDNLSDLPVLDDDVQERKLYKKEKKYESNSDDDDDNDNNNEEMMNDKVDTNENMTARKDFIKIAKPGIKIDDNNDMKSKAYDNNNSNMNNNNTKSTYHRALLFVHHKETLSLIEECIMKRYFSKVRYARLDGSMNPKRRSEIAHEFNTQGSDTKNDIRILMMTTKACGLGLNLTAADNVIFLEHDWNPYVDMQAMDRAHRIGQKLPVTVYRLIAESTIEARILGLQHHKLTLANEIINDDNTKSSIDKDNIGSSTLLSNHATLPIGNGNRNTNDDYDTMDLDNFLVSIGCD